MAEAEEGAAGAPDPRRKSRDFPPGSSSDEEFELILWHLRTPRSLGSRRRSGGRLRDVLDSDPELSPSAAYGTRRPRGVTRAPPARPRPEPPAAPARRSCGELSDGVEGSSERPASGDGEEAAERPGAEAALPTPAAAAGPDSDSSEDEFESIVHLIPRPARGPARTPRTPRTPSIRAPARPRPEPPAAPAWRSCGALSDGEEGSSEGPAPGDGEEAAERPGPEAALRTPSAAAGPDSDSSEEEFESIVHLIPRSAGAPARTPRTLSIRAPIKEGGKPPSCPRKVSRSSSPPDRRDAEESTPLPDFKGPRACSVPGCFLPQISASSGARGRKFQEEKKSLVKRLYQLYNTTVFDSKLPEDMEITWNKKLRMTAGFCATGQKAGQRHARIELSEKVCDSAERLRDTVIHEMCHAATWLVLGVRAAHGPAWKAFARRASAVHPELPKVTRCHSYRINYKFTYECARCGHRIGRHSRSLDPRRHVCGRCRGPLALLPQAGRGDGTPRPLTPFARFVKSHYASARRELAGQSHGQIMRQLGADFASKIHLQEP
ncbi:acidic repeat-containing protein [Ornithorhynchus anatinus]|uniref:acidic repeat-containing protein n=1 Tax=Ornithorhynchus anatinus TaxID=9258 RepID=UPI0010A81F49|nr:acidic repeat-containing protein [Ornithorhynchus anatinus]